MGIKSYTEGQQGVIPRGAMRYGAAVDLWEGSTISFSMSVGVLKGVLNLWLVKIVVI